MSGLGRIHAPDDRDYRDLRSIIPAEVVSQDRVWRKGRMMPLDQGQTPRCVGYSASGWLLTAPIQRPKTDPDPDTIYAKAQQVDGIKGPHDGSTVRAAFQVLQSMGHVGSYHFASDIGEVRDFVLEVGPMVFGSDWLTAMDTPDSRGVVTVAGAVRGGHAYLCRGFHSESKLLVMEQSWGRGFGLHGLFYLPLDGANELLFSRGNGEACAAIEV